MKKTKLIMPLVFLCLLILAILPMTAFADDVVAPEEEQALESVQQDVEPVYAEDLVYNGTSQNLLTPGTHGKFEGRDAKYMYTWKKASDKHYPEYSDTIPAETLAGDYDVKWKLFRWSYSAGDWIPVGHSVDETVTIGKATINAEAPTAKILNAANGSQALVEAGTVSFATDVYGATVKLQYKKHYIDDYSVDVPYGIASHTPYNVYWKAVVTDANGEENYNDLPSGIVVVSKSFLLPTVATGKVFDGTNRHLLQKEGYINGFFELGENEYEMIQYRSFPEGQPISSEYAGWVDSISEVEEFNAGTYTIQICATKMKKKPGPDEFLDREIIETTTTAEIAQYEVEVEVNSVETVYGINKDLTFVAPVLFNDDVLNAKDVILSRGENDNVKYDEAGEVAAYDISAVLAEGVAARLSNYSISFKPATYKINPFEITQFNTVITLGKALHYNGKEQTQAIGGIKAYYEEHEYTLNPTDYYVENATKTGAGTHCLTVNAAERGNYTGSVTKLFVILGDDISVKDLNGKFSVDTFLDKKMQKIALSSSLSDVAKATADANELSDLAGGEDMHVWLEVADASASVDEETKAAIEKAANGKTILGYFDFVLKKQLEYDGEKVITETSKPVSITIHLTDDQINKDASKKRTYSIVRYHDGKAEVLDGVYDEKAQTVTFTSDKFSVYALQYVDEAVPVAPKTADTNNTGLYIFMSIAALAALAWFGMSLKKER